MSEVLNQGLEMDPPRGIHPDGVATTEGLLAHAVHFAQFCLTDPNASGEVQPHFMAVMPNGRIAFLPIPEMFLESPVLKDVVAHGFRQLARERGVVRYAFVSEAWRAFYADDPALDRLPPSQRPDRREVLIVIAQDKGGRPIQFIQEFHRDADGKVIALGDEVRLPEHTRIDGRFVGLLDD